MEKTYLFRRVYALTDKYNIQYTTIHSIINMYIEYCKEELFRGRVVNITGLVSIVPDVITDYRRTTLAYEARVLARKLSLPPNTVYAVLQGYIDSLIEEVLSGKTVELRSLVSLHPVIEDGVVARVHSAISVPLKEKLETKDTVVTSFRAHTLKSLKYIVRSGSSEKVAI